ncbi:hypothetical protein [Aneurinibacillus migulanus]|uniref:Uncharacterized protein n=1 Tax=Aneurinibacillus migulanus TaxID=47500 RepID=A0A1G8ZML1_ANEMI|nr:hypothetical protein [Aneurinibacillus migulanus]MCP1358201.1 hypothetical protein [Aneurinibacillus migulanus]MED0896285.1 hypothetical protein [Aneurinibacillus migulanus]MED1615126.1 hypothetical protein [Aneurinibacillus migulanus]MED4730019.1 hypothetical protein [Aneurinibacillus migulanus]SDK15625.1 hypothetical protein SAMN04487909_14139 [Aneurinibacillus migulanus]
MKDHKRVTLATSENTEKFIQEYLPKIIARLKKEGKLPDIEREKPVK